MNTPETSPDIPDPMEYWQPLLQKMTTWGVDRVRIDDPTERNPTIWMWHIGCKTALPISAFEAMDNFKFTEKDLEEIQEPRSQPNNYDQSLAPTIPGHMQTALRLALTRNESVLIEDTARRNPDILIGRFREGMRAMSLSDALEAYLLPNDPVEPDPDTSRT